MRSKSESLTIGTLARMAGVNVETVRYYQRRGLMLKPGLPAGSIRHYGEADLARVTFIKAAQRLGFSLREVGELLKLEDGTHCDEARRLAEHKLDDVRGKLASLRRIELTLHRLVDRCNSARGAVKCPLISSLQDADPSRLRRAGSLPAAHA